MVTADEITWELFKAVRDKLKPVWDSMSPDDREADKKALRQLLVTYFNSDGDCITALGTTINPMDRTKAGGKCFKVRWKIPGYGKSGGLRLAVAVYCDEKRVRILDAWLRKDDPKNAEFEKAFKTAP